MQTEEVRCGGYVNGGLATLMLYKMSPTVKLENDINDLSRIAGQHLKPLNHQRSIPLFLINKSYKNF